jgi:hypothetical protein
MKDAACMTTTNKPLLQSADRPSPKPREGQFSLKGLFIAFTAIALLLGWHARYASERRDAIQQLKLQDIRITISGDMRLTLEGRPSSFTHLTAPISKREARMRRHPTTIQVYVQGESVSEVIERTQIAIDKSLRRRSKTFRQGAGGGGGGGSIAGGTGAAGAGAE